MDDLPVENTGQNQRLQQNIQRKANRPRRQPAGRPADDHTAEMAAAMGGSSEADDARARATSLLAEASRPTSPADGTDGQDHLAMEAGESSQKSLENQLKAAHAQLKDCQGLLVAAKTLTRSTDDTHAGALASSLLSAWGEQQTEVCRLKADLEDFSREKTRVQDSLKALEDELSALRKDRGLKACKKQQRKWWRRFLLCGGVKKNNKVGVLQDEDLHITSPIAEVEVTEVTEDTQFSQQIATQSATIRSLQRDKAILESEIAKLKDGSVAAKMMMQKLSAEKREAEMKKEEMKQKKEEVEKEKIGMEKEKKETERKIQELELLNREMTKDNTRVNRMNKRMQLQFKKMRAEMKERSELVDEMSEMCDRLKEGADIRLVQEAHINADRVVIATHASVIPSDLNPQDLRTFNHSSVEKGKLTLTEIGKGAFGVAMLARLVGVKHPIIIKKPMLPDDLLPADIERETQRNNIRFEKESVVGLFLSDSIYFPKFFGTIMVGDTLCIATEFIGDANTGKSYLLFDTLYPDPGCDPEVAMPKWNLVAIGEDIVNGVALMHENHLLHNDIKDDNVLLKRRSTRWHAVIIDLGLASTMAYPYFAEFRDSQKEARKLKKDETFCHLAPEIINEDNASVASDIYSVGVIISSLAEWLINGELLTVGDICKQENPDDRPDNIIDILPYLVHLRERLQKEEKNEDGKEGDEEGDGGTDTEEDDDEEQEQDGEDAETEEESGGDDEEEEEDEESEYELGEIETMADEETDGEGTEEEEEDGDEDEEVQDGEDGDEVEEGQDGEDGDGGEEEQDGEDGDIDEEEQDEEEDDRDGDGTVREEEQQQGEENADEAKDEADAEEEMDEDEAEEEAGRDEGEGGSGGERGGGG